MSNDHQHKPQRHPQNIWSRFKTATGLQDDPNPPKPGKLIQNMPAISYAAKIKEQLYKDRNYVRTKRARWATGAISIRLLAVGASGAATILLGLASLDGLAAWGFALSALVTLITTLEPFFNFRSRWVSADEALARWHSTEEELEAYVATRTAQDLEMSRLLEYDRTRRKEWDRFSQEWLNVRRQAENNPDSLRG